MNPGSRLWATGTVVLLAIGLFLASLKENWIERYFGISPDGGSGATEAAYAVLFLTVAAAFILRRFRASKRPGIR